jgi:hypothetical protein
MERHRTMYRTSVVATAGLFGMIALAAPTGTARADEVGSSGKGIVGGGLLGAEVVTMVESIVGVHAGWAYAVGAVAGAGGGAVGGYFVEHNSSDGRAPTYMLAGGLALIIPAVVLILDGTRYRPEEGATEDNAPVGPAAEPGAPGGGVVSPPPGSVRPAPPPPPQSLLDMHEGAVRMGVPVPDVRPVFSLAEQRQYGARAETELRMPVLHVTF